MTHFITISTIQKRKSFWYSKHDTCYYHPVHYKTQLNIAEVNRMLKLIPANASVAASAKLAPHISLRDKVYHFPDIHDAEYIACLYDIHEGWPLTNEEYLQKIEEYKQCSDYEILTETKDIIIFRKKPE